MTQIKYIRPKKVLQGKNPHEAHFKRLPNISYLQILRSTIYVFINEEEQNLNSEKFEARAL